MPQSVSTTSFSLPAMRCDDGIGLWCVRWNRDCWRSREECRFTFMRAHRMWSVGSLPLSLPLSLQFPLVSLPHPFTISSPLPPSLPPSLPNSYLYYICLSFTTSSLSPSPSPPSLPSLPLSLSSPACHYM